MVIKDWGWGWGRGLRLGGSWPKCDSVLPKCDSILGPNVVWPGPKCSTAPRLIWGKVLEAK